MIGNKIFKYVFPKRGQTIYLQNDNIEVISLPGEWWQQKILMYWEADSSFPSHVYVCRHQELEEHNDNPYKNKQK